MQILNVVLYSHTGEIRNIPFRKGAVNIITGESKKGKSSLIDIIKYCLGDSYFSVAEGVIKDSVSWYGLKLDCGKQEVFVARKAPTAGASTSSEVFLASANKVEICNFEELRGTTNPESLRKFLGNKLHLKENLHEVPDGQTRAPISAELKHALIFCIQQQDEIASKSMLFHRQSEQYLPQSIKDTLPFFLGMIPEDRLAKIGHLRELNSKLREAQRDFQEAEMVKGSGLRKGWALLAEAEEVGLVEDDVGRPRDTSALVEILKPLREYKAEKTKSMTPGDPVPALVKESQNLLTEFERLNEEVKYARKFEADQEGYSFEVNAQVTRLQSIGLYKPLDGENNACPLCKNVLTQIVPSANEFSESIATLKSQLEGVGQEKPQTRLFIESNLKRISEIKSRLKTIQSTINSIQTNDLKAKELAELERKRDRVAGRISLYLEGVTLSEASSDLKREIERLQALASRLERELGEFNFEEARDSLSEVLGLKMSEMAKQLNLEHSDKSLRLDLAKLTVVACSNNGLIPMSKMGSGANHMGYHLAAHLTLHEWFVKNDRPVPRFLFLDQPTQVYYPPDNKNPKIEDLNSDDTQSVNRMFHWLIERTNALDGQFQLIVTDHADVDESWFQNHVIEKWRGEIALIPNDWLKPK